MATVAELILQQLGGQRFVAMTGARDFMSDNTRGRGSLTFKVPRQLTRGGITHVRITLGESDLYMMECLKVRGVNCTTEYERFHIYGDRLQAVFTDVTGLDTHL